MTQPKPPTPIADDIPVDRAWKIGRRIYVRCGYQSTLNTALRDLGAKWDGEQRALWVGTGKLAQVAPLVRAQSERIAHIAGVKAANRWAQIPFDAAEIRAKAKELGGIWDGERKMWAMPTDDTLTQVSTAVTAWVRARDDARRTQHEAEQEARRADATVAAEAAKKARAGREERTIAASGRTVLDERGTASGRLHGRIKQAQAEAAKPQPGEVRRLRNGSRVLVLSSTATFWSQDAIDDGFSPDLSDDPGWYYSYTYAAVEPSSEEAEQDRVVATEQADHDEIRDVMQQASRVAETHEATGLTRLDGPTITQDAAGGMTTHGGRITVTPGGEVSYQHPGWYDDYRAREGLVTDEALISRIHAILAGGTRRRGQYQVQA